MGERVFSDRARNKRTKEVAIAEGCAHSTMVGFGEQYIIPFALRLGATNSQIAILSAVPPFLGAMSQNFSAKLSRKVKSRKKLVATFAFIQGISLAPLFIIPFFTRSIFALAVMFAIYLILGNMAHAPWSSLISEIVKEGERAEYFARRNRLMILTLVATTVAAGIILDSVSTISVWLGFWVLFTLAFIGKTVSVVFLLNYLEPKKREKHLREETLLQFISKIRETNFGRFVLFRSFLEMGVMVGGPFLAVYWLQVAEFSYLEFSILTLTGTIVRGLASPFWEKNAKRYGIRNMMFISAVLVSLLPLGWFLAGLFFRETPYAFLAFIITELLTGFAWSGMELTTFTYTLENGKDHDTATLSAHLNTILGAFTLIGGLIGSTAVYYISQVDTGYNTLKIMFLFSFIARMSATLGLIGQVKELKMGKVNENHLFFKLILMDPIGSTMHGALYRVDSFIEATERKKANDGKEILGEIEEMQKKTLAMFRQKRKRSKKKKAYKRKRLKKRKR